jgi:hypothetical protein
MLSILSFLGIDNNALRKDAIAYIVKQTNRPGSGLEIPNQKPVVHGWNQGLLVVYPKHTAEKPVYRMQGMFMSNTVDTEVMLAQQAYQVIGPVLSHMSTWVVAILLRYPPVDALRKICGHTDGQYATILQYSYQFSHALFVITNVL